MMVVMMIRDETEGMFSRGCDALVLLLNNRVKREEKRKALVFKP